MHSCSSWRRDELCKDIENLNKINRNASYVVLCTEKKQVDKKFKGSFVIQTFSKGPNCTIPYRETATVCNYCFLDDSGSYMFDCLGDSITKRTFIDTKCTTANATLSTKLNVCSENTITKFSLSRGVQRYIFNISHMFFIVFWAVY
jgi:hypothetical protein